jgi:hypothetical protein
MKIERFQDKVNLKVQERVFIEWQQICVAHLLHKAQKVTSVKFYQSQVFKKAFLSLKYFTKHMKKTKCAQVLANNFSTKSLATKVLAALKTNIEERKHYLAKLEIA